MTRTDTATQLADLLNAGTPVMDAIAQLGLDPDNGDVFSEDSSVFALDDPDNDIIDFGWNDTEDELVLLRRSKTHTDWWRVEITTTGGKT